MKKAVISFVVIIIFWEMTVLALDIPPSKLPSLFVVFCALFDLTSSGLLLHHIVASLFRVSWGYFLAVGAAIPLGLVLGLWPAGMSYLNPVIQFLRPISPLAWIPIALLWLGIGDRPAIFLIFLSTFLPMLVFCMSGVAGVNTTYLRVARNFGLKGHEFYFKVILPAAFPDIVVGLRITLGTAWLVIVAAEMIAVKSGLGYLIIDSRNSLRMDYVIGAMIIIGVIGFFLDYLIRQLEHLPVVKWSRAHHESCA